MTSPISDILERHALNYSDYAGPGLTTEEAEQALTALLNEAIGENLPSELGDTLPPSGKERFELGLTVAWNKGYNARGDDIRQKLGIPEKETKA